MRLTLTLTVEVTDEKRANKVMERWGRFARGLAGMPGVAVVQANEAVQPTAQRPTSGGSMQF